MANNVLLTEEPKRMPHEAMPIEGLCRDCFQAETCTFPRDPLRPLWSCDEFQGKERIAHRPERPSPASVGESPAEAAEVQGLCRGCANRPTCTYPKHEGGVWYCDEMV